MNFNIIRIPNEYQKIIALWDAMIKEKLFSICVNLRNLREAMYCCHMPSESNYENSPISDEDKKIVTSAIKSILNDIEKIEMDYPKYLLENHVLPSIQDSKTTYREIKGFLDEFERAYEYTLEGLICLVIPKDKALYLESNNILDQLILDKFPVSYEVEEAQICFALDRHSACVFHLMRILEAGLNELAKKFNVNFINTNWQNVIDQIEKAVKEISEKSHGNNWKIDQHKYSEICTHFRFLKDSWRNYAMHIKEQYNEERAKRIMENVFSFMKDLTKIFKE